jgi:hypothetical protein
MKSKVRSTGRWSAIAAIATGRLPALVRAARESLKVTAGESELSTYMFNKHVIEHRFCPTCGCAPFGLGKNPEGKEMAAINLRCLDVDRSGITIVPVDGKSL